MRSSILFVTCSLVLFLRCAQPVNPTGGDADKTPPQIIRSTPPINATGQKPSKITLYFNENIQLTNPAQNILISPLAGKITTTKTNKSVTIHLNPDSLKQNITYSVALNNAVSDLNEGNKGIYPPILFSTGDHLDTSIISGSFSNPFEGKTTNYKGICFTKSTTNPLVLYATKPDQETFSFYGIDTLLKEVVIYNDLNNNNFPDAGDDIGYAGSVKPQHDSVNILLYPGNKIQLGLFQQNDNYLLSGINSFLNQKILQENPSVYTFKDTSIIPSGLLADILKKLKPEFYIVPSKAQFLAFQANHAIQPDYTDTTAIPILFFNADSLEINAQSVYYTTKSDTLKHNDVSVKKINNYFIFKLPDCSRKNTIIIPEGSIKVNGIPYNKRIEIKTEPNTNNSEISFKNSTTTTLNIRLFSDKQKIEISLSPDQTYSLYVPRGTYSILYYKDNNNDACLEAPQPFTGINGEPIKLLKNIAVKEKFINEIILD